MRKVIFTVGEKVAVIEDNKITNGVIMKIFPEVNPPIIMVGFDDNTVAKVEIDRIAKIPDDTTATEDDEIEEDISEEREPVNEIMLTPDKFASVTACLISREVKNSKEGGLILGTAFSIFSAKLGVELFGDGFFD